MSHINHLEPQRLDAIPGWVDIRLGFEHISYACERHQKQVVALYEMLTHDPEECFTISYLKRKDGSGLPIQYELRCPFCE